MRLLSPRTAVLLLALPTFAASAQQPGDLSRRTGGTVITLDRTDLRGAGGQTLAAFLAGRVPGVTVAYTSGLESATPRVITRGTYGTVAAPEPLLYVDGVLWKDDAHLTGNSNNFGDLGSLSPSSVGWGLPVEEIAEIRVHLGASSALLLEEGASRGAVFVTTHRPAPGAGTTLRASLWTSARAGGALGPPNEGTFGTMSGAPTSECTLARQVAGTCTAPTGRVRWNPADQILPYQSAQGIRAAVSASSSLRGWGYRASALRDLTEGVLPGGHVDRTDLALSTTRRLGSALDLAIDVRYALSRGWRPAWDGSGLAISAIFAGPALDDTMRANVSQSIAYLYQRTPRRESDRVSVGARATWRLAPATSLAFSASQDLLRRQSHAEWPDTWFVDGSPLTTVDQSALYQRDQTLSAIVTHARPVWRGWTLESRAGARFRRTKNDERWSNMTCCVVDAFFPPSYGSSTGLSFDAEFTSLIAATRLDLGGRGMLGVGLRHEAARGARTSPTMKNAEGSWDLLRLGRERVRFGLTRVTARAGYGESIDDRVPFQRPTIFGYTPLIESALDREIAIDASWLGRLETTVAYSVTTVRDGAILSMSGGFPSAPTVAPFVGWRVDATILRATMLSQPGASTPWRVSLSALSRRPVIQVLNAPESCSPIPGSVAVSCVIAGGPLGRALVGGHTYADANDDGIIAESEVVIDPSSSIAGSPEPSWVLGFGGDMTLRHWISFGTVVESHLGQAAVDVTDLQRCRRKRCAALHDPSTPLEEQADAVAASILGGYDLSGFVRDASFVRVREVYLSLAPAAFRGASVRLAAHQLLAWTRFPSGDPEAMPRIGAVASGAAGFHEGIRPSFSIRVELAPVRR